MLCRITRWHDIFYLNRNADIFISPVNTCTITTQPPRDTAWILFSGKIVSSHTFIRIMCWQNRHLYCWDNDVRLQPVTFIFLSKSLGSLAEAVTSAWVFVRGTMRALKAENRTAICHCTLIKFIQGHCMGLKMDVKSINQSQMDYVLYGLRPVAYSRRYGGLKGHGRVHVCVCVCEWVRTYTCTCVCQFPMSDDDHWLTILIRRARGRGAR